MTEPVVDIAAGLPAPGIVRALLDRYFASDAAEAAASSHWRLYASQFSVKRGDGNRLTSLEGAGFGNASFTGFAHRAADALTTAAHFARLPGKGRLWRRYGQLARVAGSMGAAPTFDAFRQALTLDTIAQALGGRLPAPRVVIIGDGHGILSALVKDEWPRAQLTLVDLGRTLLFQTVNCQRAYPRATHRLAVAGEPAVEADFTYCPADQLAALETARFDVAINVASMQEMTPEAVSSYFSFLRGHLVKDNLFYCCNRERKVLPDGEVSAFLEYPWKSGDQIRFDGLCPWHQFYFAASPRPFRRYAGPHRHRLTTLVTESQ